MMVMMITTMMKMTMMIISPQFFDFVATSMCVAETSVFVRFESFPGRPSMSRNRVFVALTEATALPVHETSVFVRFESFCKTIPYGGGHCSWFPTHIYVYNYI